ncbi:hypothetical protein Tco_1246754 [Tanacetum coccineum]
MKRVVFVVGDPVHGLYCRQCALIRKTLEEVFQDTSKSSDDDTNFVKSRAAVVVKQGPGVNSSQSPPQIDHECCYECGDSLDGIFCQRCTCKSCEKLMEQMTSMCDMVGQLIQKKEEEKRIEEEQAAKDRYWKIPVCYDDDDDEESSIPLKDTIIYGLPSCVAITSALSTEKPVDSLIIEDEHLDIIPETESDKFIKSSVENLFPTPSEPEDFSDIESECDVLVCDNLTNFSNPSFDANDDDASSDEEEFKYLHLFFI